MKIDRCREIRRGVRWRDFGATINYLVERGAYTYQEGVSERGSMARLLKRRKRASRGRAA